MSLEELKIKYKWPKDKPNVKPNPQGWFHDCNKQVANEVLNDKMSIIIELGSWLGKSTRYFLENSQAIVIAIDHWEGSTEHKRRKDKRLDTLYETFLINCWQYKERLIPLRNDTISGLKEIKALNIIPDLAYIDASHDYKSVCLDIMTTIDYFPEINIFGDDWLWGKRKPVQQAVKDCANKLGKQIQVIDNAWYFVNF